MIHSRHMPDDPRLAEVLALIRSAFAGMEGRIDPPSSVHRLTEQGLAAAAAAGEVWSLGAPVAACMVLTPRPGRLYIGKMAVAAPCRGRGLSRALVALAETRARALSLPLLELQTRIELVENHATFAALGFVETARTAHPGHDRPTSITMERAVPGVPPAGQAVGERGAGDGVRTG